MAHWISSDESSGRLTLRAALIGFHHLKKKHSGANIAKNVLHLLDQANVTLKVGISYYIYMFIFPCSFVDWPLHT
jgi:hypothetical protein